MDGAPLHTVKLVGRVTYIGSNEARSAWKFILNDSTGVIALLKTHIVTQAILSMEERIAREETEDLEMPPLPRPPWEDDTYMCVLGKLISLEEVNVTNMRPITDFNEVTMHNLQCIFDHCCLTKTKE